MGRAQRLCLLRRQASGPALPLVLQRLCLLSMIMRRPRRGRVTSFRQAQTQNRDAPEPQRMLPLCGARDRQLMCRWHWSPSPVMISLPTWFFSSIWLGGEGADVPAACRCCDGLPRLRR